MADRMFFPASKSLDREVVMLFGVVTFGASGAVSSVDAKGFTVTKPAGTGLYTITLEDKYAGGLIGASLVLYNGGTASLNFWQIAQEYDSSDKTIDVQHIAESAGTLAAANATSGHKLYITLHLRNTGAPRNGV